MAILRGGVFMALGLPSVNIVFKQEGITAIERGERGIVALVLKDSDALGGHTVYDITDCPEELSEENRRYVIDALIGNTNAPLRVELFVVSDLESEKLTNALNYYGKDILLKVFGQNKNHFVDCISILHFVSLGRKAKTTSSIKYSRNSTESTCNCYKSGCNEKLFFVRNNCKTTSNVQEEHKPDTDIVSKRLCFKNFHDCRLLFAGRRFVPVRRFCKKKVSNEHHYKVNGTKNVEHLIDRHIFLHFFHNWSTNSFCSTESCYSKTCCKTLVILEPEHKCFNW